MRIPTKLLLAGFGAAAIAGVAIAAADRAHVVNVVLPDGSIARIHYVGDTVPRVVMAPAAIPVAFVEADPFAMIDHISMAMDRQMDALLRQASMMARAAPVDGRLSEAALHNWAPGMVSYSYSSYSSGSGGSCSQTVQITSLGQNQAPKVVRRSAGDCTAMNRRTPTQTVDQAKAVTPAVTRVSFEKPQPSKPEAPVI